MLWTRSASHRPPLHVPAGGRGDRRKGGNWSDGAVHGREEGHFRQRGRGHGAVRAAGRARARQEAAAFILMQIAVMAGGRFPGRRRAKKAIGAAETAFSAGAVP